MRKLLLFLAVAAAALLSSGLSSPPGAFAAGCAGEGPESTVYGGRASGTTMYQVNYCSDPTLMLSVDLQWSNGKKDLALHVTEPDGTVHVADMKGISEHFLARAPLAEGTWTIEVVNNGPGSVSYALTVSFVTDPNY